MVNKKYNKDIKFNFNIEKYNTNYSLCTQRWFFIIVILLTLLLIIKKSSYFENMSNLFIERILLFSILLFLLLILTRNTVYSFIGTIILFLLFNLLLMYSNKINKINIKEKNNYIESFQNEKNSDSSSNTNSSTNSSTDIEEEEEEEDQNKTKISREDFNSALEKIDTNIEKYQNDTDVKNAAEGIQGLLQKLNGGIEIKKSDLQETKPLNVDTKTYENEKKNNSLQKAQKETYELINSVSALKDTLTTLSPVLSQGKEIMSLFENLKL